MRTLAGQTTMIISSIEAEDQTGTAGPINSSNSAVIDVSGNVEKDVEDDMCEIMTDEETIPMSVMSEEDTTHSAEKTESDKRCIIHIGPYKEESVKRFTKDTWDRVQSAVHYRLQHHGMSSKYSSLLTLAETHGPHDGYHSTCYKNFTAIPKLTSSDEPMSVTQEHNLRSDVQHPATSSSGVFEEVCIFCNCKHKSAKGFREGLGDSQTKGAEIKIKAAAHALNDQHMITKIGNIEFCAKEVKYHHSCRKAYINRANRSKPDHSTTSEYSKLRELHRITFAALAEYVKTNVINENRPELLPSLHSRYLSLLAENGAVDSTYSSQSLGEKLVKEFSTVLTIAKMTNRQGNVVFNSSMDMKEAFDYVCSVESRVTQTALDLRAAILQLKVNCKDLPYPLTADAVVHGQGNPPDIVNHFFRILYTGSTVANQTSDRAERYISSAAQDAVYATTRGAVKPAKHLCLGLGMKSLTGSRKVLEILNHLGHSVGYHVVESLETDLAMTVSEKNLALPEGLFQVGGLCTGIAWDNYDENTETLSGSGTLHDTVGICYQNTRDADQDSGQVNRGICSSNAESRPKRKRTFVSKEKVIEPYRKKPRMSTFQYKIKEENEPENLETCKAHDFTWMISCALFDNTPMWVGWNSLVTVDPLPIQQIGYMDSINLPPTRHDVVAETLRISQKVAQECGDRFAIVHYDLAIAKPALQIQVQESPRYDDVFICFGQFHIQMAYFASVGHLVDESGGPQVLVNTEVLAAGSVNGFVSGKHFNRCKRLHPILATAFRILHFKHFLDKYNDLSDSLKSQMQDLLDNSSIELLESIEGSDEYSKLKHQYDQYTDETRQGKHGPTAQFWMLYVDLIELYLLFSRACRTNDVSLFVYCLGRMCPVFFAASRHNYARWMVKYHLNLMNVDETHPGVKNMLEGGALTIRRTSKSFSRCPVDLTLEQTVNADAASRLTGIAAFTQSIGARNRWTITRIMRSEIVGALLDIAGMKVKEDTSQELKANRIKRDNEDLNKLVTGIQETMNPFVEVTNDTNLYNIATGRAVSEPVKSDVLNFGKLGEKWCNDFKDGCYADSNRFEAPIPRQKVKNFASDATKTKVKAKDMKVKELQGTRDLFGRLLYLAASMDIDLKRVFGYPLTPVPMVFGHVDGIMHKTDKAKLLHKLEGMIESSSPVETDACVVDAMFLIHTFTNLPDTYGAVAKVMLKKLCEFASRVDFVCDTYKEPSIKDIEHAKRGATNADMAITGPDQKRPKDFKDALKSAKFKMALFRFLVDEWQKDSYAIILQEHTLYVGIDGDGYSFCVRHGKVVREVVDELMCQHVEADTRIVWHVKHIAMEQQTSVRISVRASDTDVLIILLYHVFTLGVNACIWMDVGISSNNTRRYIDVTVLANHLGRDVCLALPAFHAFTGSDFTPAFWRKGKVRPLDMMVKSSDYTHAFGKLGDAHNVSADCSATIESYVCTLYGRVNNKNVNDARFVLFEQSYEPKNRTGPLEKLRGIDSSLLPPCQSVLTEQIRRVNYVAGVWKRANTAAPEVSSPESHGWELKDGHYQMNWFEGEQIPENVCQHVDDNSIKTYLTDNEDELYYNSSSDESDYDD